MLKMNNVAWQRNKRTQRMDKPTQCFVNFFALILDNFNRYTLNVWDPSTPMYSPLLDPYPKTSYMHVMTRTSVLQPWKSSLVAALNSIKSSEVDAIFHQSEFPREVRRPGRRCEVGW